jgi:hypothetical protein
MSGVNVEGVAGVIAVHGKRRNQERPVDADGVHGGHHVVTRDLRRAVESGGPGSARVVAFIGVYLGIYCDHDFQPYT